MMLFSRTTEESQEEHSQEVVSNHEKFTRFHLPSTRAAQVPKVASGNQSCLVMAADLDNKWSAYHLTCKYKEKGLQCVRLSDKLWIFEIASLAHRPLFSQVRKVKNGTVVDIAANETHVFVLQEGNKLYYSTSSGMNWQVEDLAQKEGHFDRIVAGDRFGLAWNPTHNQLSWLSVDKSGPKYLIQGKEESILRFIDMAASGMFAVGLVELAQQSNAETKLDDGDTKLPASDYHGMDNTSEEDVAEAESHDGTQSSHFG